MHAFDKSFGTTSVEAGNSERICKDSYFRMISNLRAVETFWAIRPETFGFETPEYKVGGTGETGAQELTVGVESNLWAAGIN